MDKELFKLFLQQLQGMGRLLHFHVMGEPLLHPDLSDFLDMCAPYGYRVNVVTNGLLLPSVAHAILGKQALRQVSISLHHLSERMPVHEIDAYFQGLSDFMGEVLISRGLFVSLRLWNREAVVDSAFCSDVTRRIAELFSLNPANIDNCANHAPVRLAENIWLNRGLRFQWPSLENKNYGDQGTCLGLREQIAVLVDGTVTPCCLDCEGIIALGNVRQNCLSDIVKGPRARAISEGFAQGKIVEPLCGHCSYRLRFKL